VQRPSRRDTRRILAVLMAGVCLSVVLTALYDWTRGDRGLALPVEDQQLIDRVNTIRAKASCPPVTANPALTAMAQAQANDMVSRGFLSSVNPDNEDTISRARMYGYPGTVMESFAAGLSTPSEVVGQWTNSANLSASPVMKRIRTCGMVSVGIGHNTGTVRPALAAHVWVMTLGDK
jgi:uncharacterized protein YkwD